jgi:hypothetical protein
VGVCLFRDLGFFPLAVLLASRALVLAGSGGKEAWKIKQEDFEPGLAAVYLPCP